MRRKIIDMFVSLEALMGSCVRCVFPLHFRMSLAHVVVFAKAMVYGIRVWGRVILVRLQIMFVKWYVVVPLWLPLPMGGTLCFPIVHALRRCVMAKGLCIEQLFASFPLHSAQVSCTVSMLIAIGPILHQCIFAMLVVL